MEIGSIGEFLATTEEQPLRVILSNPVKKDAEYRRFVYMKKKDGYQREAYTATQVFHKNLTGAELSADMQAAFAAVFRQCNLFYESRTVEIKVSKAGKCLLTQSVSDAPPKGEFSAHNREKKYLIPEGTIVPPLVDMGIFTKEGKVVASMRDKFRQINRFVEIVADAADCLPGGRPIRILDFGCGKSYLTFILYYYFTEIRGDEVNITGLDLKADVIRNCNAAAERYGYTNLHFSVGDIGGFAADEPIDMVVTLHACDTATDFALFHAIRAKASLILSVPCCQHEINREMSTEAMPILGRYGIIKERTAALLTDAIRAELLTACGYKTQVLEFVDLSHTPKNLLLRATRCLQPASVRRRAAAEVTQLLTALSCDQKLYSLLTAEGLISPDSGA